MPYLFEAPQELSLPVSGRWTSGSRVSAHPVSELPISELRPFGRGALRTAVRHAVSLSIPLTLVVLGAPAHAPAEPRQPAAATQNAATPHGILVLVEGNRVTVDVDDVDLADVLEQLAERAAFRLRTKGTLGRVTADFTAPSIEQALRRLVGSHELMIVYGSPAGDRSRARPIQVDVFGDRNSPAVTSPPSAAASESSRATTLAEIRDLASAPDPQRGAARLAEIAATGPEPAVRGRAIWALGRVGGPVATSALVKCLDDGVAEVRVQAVYAIRQLQSAQAIPALSARLLGDQDSSVRRAAARALATLPDPEAGAALSAAVEDADPIVKREVTRALARRSDASSR